jgi:hypothetical protein
LVAAAALTGNDDDHDSAGVLQMRAAVCDENPEALQSVSP